MTILDPTQSYTFSKYFEMHISPQDFAEEFGYTFTRKRENQQQTHLISLKAEPSILHSHTEYGNEENEEYRVWERGI